MRTARALFLFLTAVTAVPACYFRVGTGPAPTEMQGAPASTAQRPAATPAATSVATQPRAPSPAPAQTATSSPPPALTPAAIDALLKGTWRTAARSILLPGGSAPAPAPPPPPSPAGCLSVGANVVVPLCAPRLGACMATTVQRCATYSRTMVPSVATEAVTCINGLSTTQQCDPLQLDNCGHAALARACPDTGTVGPLCELASGRCKSSQTECLALLSGLASDVQDNVARCVAQGCPAGLYACVEGLGTAIR